MQADKLIRELQSNNRLLKSELQATTTSFRQALHVAQSMLDTGEPTPPPPPPLPLSLPPSPPLDVRAPFHLSFAGMILLHFSRGLASSLPFSLLFVAFLPYANLLVGIHFR